MIPEGPAGDRRAMGRALVLARRALGTTAPNPAVGCVLVRDGRVVGEGATGPGGRPHGEAVALAAAGPAARGATAYVTLEPCAHQGATPPCARALVDAGVARVVVACDRDPDPRVSGRGLAMLRAAGLSVETGLFAGAAAELNAGFFTRLALGRPLFTLKLAASADGRIATRTGASRWITGPVARAAVHRLRAGHDGVLAGSGTVLADDPLLTCRLPGREDRPGTRIVLDSTLRIPAGARLLAGAAAHPVTLVAGPAAPAERVAAMAALPGVTVLRCGLDASGRLDLPAAARLLGGAGLTRVLVEAGGRLAAAFLTAGLVDRLVLHRAPMLIGGDGVPMLAGLGVGTPDEAPRLRLLGRRRAGQDLIETFAVRMPGTLEGRDAAVISSGE